MHNGQVFGWPVVADMFLGGLAAVVMIVSVLAARQGKRGSLAFRLLPFAAPVAISLALLALFIDLDGKAHVFRFFTTFRVTSPMSWGSWILMLVYPATILYGISRLDVPGRIADWARAHSTLLARANVVLGVALGSYTGVLLTAAGRPAWASIAIAPLFLASAVMTGAAACKLAPIDDEEYACVCRWLAGAIVAELALLFAWFIDLRGIPYTAAMWAIVIIAGLAAPLVMELFELRVIPSRVDGEESGTHPRESSTLPRDSSRSSALGMTSARHSLIAPALVLAGAAALRWIVVAAGFTGGQ